MLKSIFSCPMVVGAAGGKVNEILGCFDGCWNLKVAKEREEGRNGLAVGAFLCGFCQDLPG